jgi:adenosylhomocysteinase
MMTQDRAIEAEREVGRINAFFPILQHLGNQWAASRPWEGTVIGLNLHLTSLTAALVREIALGGAECVVSAANPGTTDPGTVDFLRNLGIPVYTGGDMENRHLQLLEHEPTVLVDVGFECVNALLTHRQDLIENFCGAVEVTRSGITKLRSHQNLPFPIININDGRLKNAVENRHGVGEAIWQAVSTLTGMHLAGRRVAIVGYGPVGRGLAMHAKAAGLNVEVVERDSIRRLFAHYDGYPTPTLHNALQRVAIAVTATGHPNVLTVNDLKGARDGLMLVNAGHGGDEIDVESIKRSAERVDYVADQVVRYRLENGTRVTVLGDGHPLNIVLNSGSPEPVLLHFAVLGMALEWVASGDIPPGEVLVTEAIEQRAAQLALDALNLAG